MIAWRDVHSKSVFKIGYDIDTEELWVQWRRGGRTSIYSDVPPDVANQAATAWSVGKFLDENVKKTYPHRYARDGG
jgi:hypothetical protein